MSPSTSHEVLYDAPQNLWFRHKIYRRLVVIPGEVDLVNVFRRSVDIPAHLDDMLAKRPKAVWFQSGIRNAEVAERLARAGIKVVQDRCLMIDHQRYTAPRGCSF